MELSAENQKRVVSEGNEESEESEENEETVGLETTRGQGESASPRAPPAGVRASLNWGSHRHHNPKRRPIPSPSAPYPVRRRWLAPQVS